MNLAINFSHTAAALLAEERIEVDIFKCPDWPDMITEALRYRPVAVHFTLRAGSGLLSKTDWVFIERLMQLTRTPHVNLHLEPRPEDFPTSAGSIPINTQDPAHVSLIVERLLADVSAMTEHFGPEGVIAENVAYWGANGEVLRPATEPGMIHRIVEETGCGLLLDISHARITARNQGVEETAYINSLPLDRIRELHITGVHAVTNGWQDHLPMLAEDWPWVDMAVENIKNGTWGPAWMLAFEYGGEGRWFTDHTDPDAIADNVPRLWKKIKLAG